MKRKFTACMARLVCLNGLAITVLATATGCTGLNHWYGEIQGCVSNHMVDYSNRALAERAWITRKQRYSNFQYQQEFKDGFISGYLDIANGGDGCTPTIAPQTYWGWAYQTPNGQAAVSNFFQGFPFGAKAAEEDGVGYWSAIPTSGLGALNPARELAPSIESESSLPVPVPVIETGPLSTNKVNRQMNGINLPIKSPSDTSSASGFEALVDSQMTGPIPDRVPSGNLDRASGINTGAANEGVKFVLPPATKASTNTSKPELTFKFE